MSENEEISLRGLNQDEYERRKRKIAQKKKRDEINKERLSYLKSDSEDDDKPAPQKELLKARSTKLNLDASVGKTQVVQGFGNKQPGFYCEHCDVTLKDNLSWLDHINGKKHLSEIGISLRVERSTLEQVRAKLLLLKQKRDAPRQYDFDESVKEAMRKEEEEKELRKKKKKELTKKKKEVKSIDASLPDDMAKIMGFSGFDSTKK
ncbi:hypothetical protein K502DRAFT_365436 [Neoconidiobolus thromboides FSU 785]|nr:hypothetical protein K502DRAFT_365436 [Neoconidiobolus thromboides FSU 785]